MKKEHNDYTEDCRLATAKAQFASREEIRLFAIIISQPLVDAWLIGDVATKRNGNPHGLANIGDMVFSMKDVHSVVANYSELLEKYETNDGIAERIYAWSDGIYSGTMKEELQTWLLGRKEPTNDDKQSAKEYIERLKQELYEETEKYKQSNNGGF